MQRTDTSQRAVSIPALIDRGPDRSRVDCTVVEIANDSARIKVWDSRFIGETFTLLLSDNLKVRRQCVVVARRSHELMVRWSR